MLANDSSGGNEGCSLHKAAARVAPTIHGPGKAIRGIVGATLAVAQEGWLKFTLMEIAQGRRRSYHRNPLEHREIAFNLPGMNLPAVLAPLDRLRIEESLVDRVPQRLAYQGIIAQPFQRLAKCRGQQAGVPL